MAPSSRLVLSSVRSVFWVPSRARSHCRRFSSNPKRQLGSIGTNQTVESSASLWTMARASALHPSSGKLLSTGGFHLLTALITFLRRSVRSWLGSTRNDAPPNSSAVATVEDAERISRFIFDCRKLKPRDSFRNFLPPDKGEYTDELSVFRTSELSEAHVWRHGDEHVASEVGRPIIGRADFEARAVRETEVDGTKLDIKPTPPPPPLHAVIIGWPPVADDMKRKNVALELRARANPTIIHRAEA